MKNSIIFIFSLIMMLSCNAQQVYPLTAKPTQIPQNSYMKDLNNDLSKYVGNWKGIYDNKVYYLNISKQQDIFVNAVKIYQDVIKVQYTVTNISETIVLNTNSGINFSSTSSKNAIFSFGIKQGTDTVNLYYGGTNCGVGWGRIELSKINPTQMYWSYYPNSTTIDDLTCPPGQDLKIYLPITKNLIFTKQ